MPTYHPVALSDVHQCLLFCPSHFLTSFRADFLSLPNLLNPSIELYFTDSSFLKFIILFKNEYSEIFPPIMFSSCPLHSYIPDISAALGRAHFISDMRKHIVHPCTRECFPIKDVTLKEFSKLVSLRKK